MKVVVLLSCMHEDGHEIIERTNIQTDVVVINQCDKEELEEFQFRNKSGALCRAKFINTKERGLSRSRNMAINNAWGDICLICDDDELLEDDYEEKIKRAYDKHPSENIIVFTIERRESESPKTYPNEERYVGLKQLLQTSSVQVTFKRDAIIKANISFDVMLGSGTGNGAGEENKFLMDCKRNGMKIYYVPLCLGAVLSGISSWFSGYNKKYMIDRGWSSKRALGHFLGFLYISYFAISHKSLYKKEMNMTKAYYYLLKGYCQTR